MAIRQTRARRLLSLLLAFAMVLSFLSVSAFAATTYKDGTYQGSGTGYGGTMTVSVTVSDGKITAIENVSNSETATVWTTEKANQLYNSIMAAQSTNVDGISGATKSSDGVKAAVNDALTKAAQAAADADPDAIFSSGSGTEKDPYVIKTASQLANFATSVDNGTTYADQYIVLDADIDLSTYNSWNPIGEEGKDAANIFAGIFDGKGHIISNMKIAVETTTEVNVGLFSTLGNAAVVKNVNMTGVDINVTNNGTASATSQCRAGSLAGNTVNADKDSANLYEIGGGTLIDGCSATGKVTIDTTAGAVMTWGAGRIGRAMIGTAITNCWTDVDVTAYSRGGPNSAYAGGIVGPQGNWTYLANCAAFGDSYASSPKSTNFGGMAGGIVGMGVGMTYNVYAMGNATIGNGGSKYSWIGTIGGEYTSSGMTKQNDNSYDYCDNGAYRGYGYYSSSITLTEIDYSSDEDGTSSTLELVALGGPKASATGTVSTYDKVFKTTAMNAEEMAAGTFVTTLNSNLLEINKLMQAYNSNPSVCSTAISGVSDRIALREWELVDGKVLPTGDVWVNGEIDASIFASGEGTAESPYIIQTAGQLRAFAASLNDKIDYTNTYVKLGDNIDISGSNWTPVGGSDWAFNGTFDGAGYTISGLTVGSEEAPAALTSDNPFIGLFGVLGADANVKNVKLTSVAIYTKADKISTYVGGIAGYMEGKSSGYTGAVLDGCSVSGVIKHTAEPVSGTVGNQFVGGLVGMQYKGAIINSASTTTLSCIANGEALAEVGGLVGLNNRGLVANCYADSDIYGSGSRANGLEGMAVVSPLVAVQAGALVNCYASGNTTTKEFSTYVGMVSGWVTGIGKSYTCWYDLDSTMYIGEDDVKQTVKPVEPIGTKVTSGVNDEGDAYTGGLVDAMTGYDGAGYSAIVTGLNGTFSAFPIDITQYGLAATALKSWTYDSTSNLVTFGTTNGTVTYVQPECEKVVAAEQAMQDGVWYGRDESKASVVKITVADGEITNTEVVSGGNSGEAYDAAVAEAKQKAVYGDFSHYEAADASKFAGGSGTESAPYLISNEAQLRYLAYSINEDVDWSGVYFKQTANIDLSGSDWLPIGWALNAEVNGAKKLVAAYPFRGNYDGGDFTISGLIIGSDEKAADQMTSGLFGFTAGEYADNSEPTDSEQTVTLKNIHLENVDLHVSTRYETYTGGLLGNGQTGIYIDNCSVTGKIDVTTSESFARAGGLAANVLRGAVTNCWTDVDITASTDASNVYAGGMFSLTNRVTVINCYALGDVTGNSTNNNKVHIGGFTGQQGGVQINCYAAGNVISLKSTTDVGGMNGRNGGIAADYYCYYNTEATQKNGDATNETNVAVGVNANNQSLINAEGKTKAELASADFTVLLNSNLGSIDSLLSDTGAVGVFLSNLTSRGYTHLNYYQDNDLLAWALNSGTVGFGAAEANPGTSGSGGSSSGGGSGGASTYTVGTSSASNGSVSVSPTSAAKGTVVTVTVAPNAGYQLDALAVTDASGNQLPLTNKGNGVYTFTMPASKVTVSAAFTKEAEDTPITTVSFTDVPSGEYYYDAVVWAVENGVTTGTTPTTFSPNDSCTRAQMVTFLWRAAGSPAPTSGGNPFTDVSSSAYYYDAVLWAVENGITNGTSVTTFSPDDAVTRAQTVTFLWRTENTPDADVNNPFADVPAGTYYTDAVLWAVEHEVTNGTSVTTFSPDEDCVRAQIVTFLYRANSN